MTKENAESFFAILFGGAHHIPGKIVEHGFGWRLICHSGSLATWDGDTLTRFVIMCHHFMVRGEINPCNFQATSLCIWQRKGRDGKMSERHPTIEQAAERHKMPETL